MQGEGSKGGGGEGVPAPSVVYIYFKSNHSVIIGWVDHYIFV